jgi:uncharacterized protein DUF5681
MDTKDPEDQPDSGPEAGTDEAVGYGKPPRHSRFKPGRSGNPRGRPKGAAGCKTVVERVALLEYEVIEHGKPQRRMILELVVQVLRRAAAEGDPQALAKVNDLLENFEPQGFEATGPYIFMNELLSPEELQADWDRSRAVQQQELEAWEARRQKQR